MSWILDQLGDDASDQMRAFAHDLALREALQDPAGGEEALQLAVALLPHIPLLLEVEPTYVDRLAAYSRLALAARIAGAAPPPLPERPRRGCGWDDEILRAVARGARAVASGKRLDEAIVALRALPERQSEQEAGWLREHGANRSAAYYLLGLYHAAAAMRHHCEAAAGQSDGQRAITHWRHVSRLDGALGPSPLTQLPSPELVAAALAN